MNTIGYISCDKAAEIVNLPIETIEKLCLVGKIKSKKGLNCQGKDTWAIELEELERLISSKQNNSKDVAIVVFDRDFDDAEVENKLQLCKNYCRKNRWVQIVHVIDSKRQTITDKLSEIERDLNLGKINQTKLVLGGKSSEFHRQIKKIALEKYVRVIDLTGIG